MKRNRRKTYKKKRTMRRKQKGGDCGCNKPLLTGGNINPASYDGGKYTYPLNTYNGDPSDPSVVLSARMLPNGGGNILNLQYGGRKSRRLRKIKGGDPLLGSNYDGNTLTNFWTTSGAINGASLITGSSRVNTSVGDQPILQKQSTLA
jgi:hypothetical protein